MNLRQASGSLMRGYTQLETTKQYREKAWMFHSSVSLEVLPFFSELARHLC